MKTDAIIIAVLSVPTYLFLLSIDAFDELYAITRAHENWELDEIITLIGVAGLAAGIYAYRRILDLNGEVTKRKKAEGTANDLARHDPLTGLSNRRDFLERAQGELTNISKNRESAIFVIDLDYFKPVNDLYGHRIGDGALREVALRLKRAVNGQGVVARLGGDEFGILLTAMQNADTAERVARRIVHEIAEPIYVEALAINIGVSVGVTLINMDAQHENIVTEGHGADECVQQYLRRADMAMYKAKTEGRGRFRFFEKDMDEKLKLHIQLEAELANAISSGQIIPFYQKLVDLPTQKMFGFEILARWQHPVRGILLPEVFIPIAEDTGLISKMTISVLQQAIEDAKHWPKELTLSLNLSPRQLANKWLAQELLGVLTRSNFPPHRLEIEITESGLLERIDDVRGVLASLRNVGVRIALDDFGTGYSGLYHLRDLPIDTVKIDRSFVTDMLKNSEDSKIVEAVVNLSNAMGMLTIAEGVETPGVVNRLLELGCASAQGFYFGKPQDAVATLKAISEDRSSAKKSA